MFNILIADKLGQDGIDQLESYDDVNYDIKTGLDEQQLCEAIKEYDGLIVRSAAKPTAKVIAAADNLKVIGRAGIGVDNIDIKAATERGIIVMNTPQANTIATAEHAMTMMLAVSRHTANAHHTVQQGKWDKSKYTGQQLYRKTLGLIGFGRIARLVSKYAKSFGMDVCAYDPFVSEAIAAEHNVKLVNLDELLASADYISLHTVATPDTENMINQSTIEKMKTGVIIVNSARGKLIDEAALANALNSGKVKAAAVDVYQQEPPASDHPFLGLDNVLTLPHLGASTAEAQSDVATQIVQQVVDALRGSDFKNSINMPFNFGPDFDQLQPYLKLAEKIGTLHYHMAEHTIRKIEIQVGDESAERLIKPVACGFLKGLLDHIHGGTVNYISAPGLAESHGIKVTQSQGQSHCEYSTLVSAKCHFDNGESRIISGTVFDKQTRIVQISDYHLDINPEGILMIMLNHDRPGVIGKVGTILADNQVNIAEWRLGRTQVGQQAMAFINLDSEPEAQVVNQITAIDDVIKTKIISF